MLQSNGQGQSDPLVTRTKPGISPSLGEPVRFLAGDEYRRGQTRTIEEVREETLEPLPLKERGQSKPGQFLFAKKVVVGKGGGRFAPDRIPGPINFINRLLDLWELDQKDAVALLGFEEREQALAEAVLDGRRSLSGRDARDRIAALFRVRSLLSSLFRDINTERKWLNAARDDLGNRSPIELMREGSMESLLTVRQIVERISNL